MQTTRRKILAYLSTHPPASAIVIGRELRMTAANIRHHLRRLEEDNLVKVVEKGAVDRRGRPTFFYGLTQRARNEDLRRLTTALWLELFEDLPEAEQGLYFRKLARRILATERDPEGSLTQRLYSAVRQLRSLEYSARWEAHADSPRVILEHCPYAGIQGNIPKVCSLEQEILSTLIGQPVEQIAERNPGREGTPQCIFQVIQE